MFLTKYIRAVVAGVVGWSVSRVSEGRSVSDWSAVGNRVAVGSSVWSGVCAVQQSAFISRLGCLRLCFRFKLELGLLDGWQLSGISHGNEGQKQENLSIEKIHV